MSPTTMIGRSAPTGPGGGSCTCCGQPVGKQRQRATRAAKRREKQRVRRDLALERSQDEERS